MVSVALDVTKWTVPVWNIRGKACVILLVSAFNKIAEANLKTYIFPFIKDLRASSTEIMPVLASIFQIAIKVGDRRLFFE
jgi:hypothetical protein